MPMAEAENTAMESSSHDVPDRLPFPPVTYAHILHCSYHDWHPRYRPLIPKSRLIPLTSPFLSYLRADGIVLPPEAAPPKELGDDELDAYPDDDEEEPDPSKEWEDIHTRIKDTITELGGKVTPKLNWSAPKDATFMAATNDTQCQSPNDIYLLLKSSDFITHDLEHPFDDCEPDQTNGESTQLAVPEVPYHLVLRQYVNFNPSVEFRCFVRNRVLLCICQRDQNHFDFLFGMRDMLRSRIQSFFDEKLRDTFPDPNFVFDVYIPAPHQRVWLIDINPWAQRTDPLLFSWLEILRMKDPIGFEDADVDGAAEGFVRISLRDGSVITPESDDEAEKSSVEEHKAIEDTAVGGDDELAPFLPEFRLIKVDDPEAYSFNTPQYSAHKVPKDVVDASLAGPGGMSEFMGKWQDILKMQEQEDRDAGSASE
ncbi:Cell division cycle protein [Penicillium macrosclerotiorum]|uniref:Cell division cycle protein n=1 Tax=Penicillium macrosclerotiorum TaxID=303699 RepID=UPI0025475ADE|nr:Cell division cycle protein [Penicillium macrosclerotiorum]KAJ5669321.1 Cell division cycle protein [Penicillium macrosclerotiorum]